MTIDHNDTAAVLLAGEQRLISKRLHALAHRALSFDAGAVHAMHQHLDRFRTEQQQRRLAERAEAEQESA
ncbi:hypothetical protein [Isoptericola rhizosphaerae]|uniref:hypothetical protein n=1 Tax=Isoptericola rhizosphaerae TaxID=3377837 RepID=UPI00383BF5DF